MGIVEGTVEELLADFKELKTTGEASNDIVDAWISRFQAVLEKYGNVNVFVKNSMILKRIETPICGGGFFESLEN